MKKQNLLLISIVLLGIFSNVKSQQVEKRFSGGLNYLLYLPDGYGKDTSKKWPLILFLHGGGERGHKIDRIKANGIPKQIEQGKKLPFIVVSPQIPSRSMWNPDLVVLLMKDILKNYKVDDDRVYLTGLSIGGFATWETCEKYPELFAAVAPVSGWGDPKKAWKIRHMPVWIFHGAKDPVVPVIASEVMADSLKKYNNVKITVFPEAGHNCWNETYSNDQLYAWFLDHKRFRFVESPLSGSAQKYTGLFLSETDTAKIFQQNGELLINYGSGSSMEADLKPASPGTFFLKKGELEEIHYSNDGKEKMGSFIFYSDSPRVYTRIR